MTKSYIDEVLERAEKATPGPWYCDGDEVRYDCSPYTTESGICDCTIRICTVHRISEELDHAKRDRELIAHSRQDLVVLAEKLKKAIYLLRTAAFTIGLKSEIDGLALNKLADELERAPSDNEE